MQANHSSPLRGLVSAIALLGLGALLEYLFHWLVVPILFGLLCVYVLACRVVEWAMRNEQELLEAVYAGLPFGLILLAVFQLK
jgi:hypothetical protein